MKMFIPSIGDKFVLAKDWHFNLWCERRNHKAFQFFGIEIKDYWPIKDKSYPMVFPTGTILTVDRIYIRQGKTGYDSVTFRADVEPKVITASSWWGSKGPKKTMKIRSVRFWAKLSDVNMIEFEKAS